MKDYRSSTTLGLYHELEVCASYGNSLLSPPEEATTRGYDKIVAIRNAVKSELERRKNGVVVGRTNNWEDWEDVPWWHHTVYCVRFPVPCHFGEGCEVVAYHDEKYAAKAAKKFNEEATDDFLNRYSKAQVEAYYP